MVDFKDPESMSQIIGNTLRYGVVVSASIILIGSALLLASNGSSGVSSSLNYYPNQIPHGSFDVSLQGLLSGLSALQPFAIIELGVIVLLATPVVRVLTSVFLFAAEGDRLYMYITSVVLAVLLFSILVTPYIPLFQA